MDKYMIVPMEHTKSQLHYGDTYVYSETRYMIVNAQTGAVVHNAHGHGFRSIKSAKKELNYICIPDEEKELFDQYRTVRNNVRRCLDNNLRLKTRFKNEGFNFDISKSPQTPYTTKDVKKAFRWSKVLMSNLPITMDDILAHFNGYEYFKERELRRKEMTMLEKAILISKTAHLDQKDKGGNPYFEHPAAVAEMVKKRKEKIVAYLHDTIEDTPVTSDFLINEGFSEEIVNAVILLSKNPEVDYWDYLKAIKECPLACAVKIADLTHNSDLSRIPVPTQKDKKRREKYLKAIAFLNNFEEEMSVCLTDTEST